MHWHHAHKKGLTFGQRIADAVAATMGSWPFVIGQTIFLGIWIFWNSTHSSFDPPPFIALNLLLSFEAAYAAPFIMISQNRQADRDRHHAEADYVTNLRAKEEIEELQQHLARIEIEKLDKIIKILENHG